MTTAPTSPKTDLNVSPQTLVAAFPTLTAKPETVYGHARRTS